MDTAIHIDNLSVYYGETAAIKNICLDVKQGEFLGIIGPNGGGKSTLLKAILGLIPITTGNIQIYGKTIGRIERRWDMYHNLLPWTGDFPYL